MEFSHFYIHSADCVSAFEGENSPSIDINNGIIEFHNFTSLKIYNE